MTAVLTNGAGISSQCYGLTDFFVQVKSLHVMNLWQLLLLMLEMPKVSAGFAHATLDLSDVNFTCVPVMHGTATSVLTATCCGEALR